MPESPFVPALPPTPPEVPAAAPGMPAWAAAMLAAIVVGALYFGREVLVPVTIAMLLSFLLSPLIDLLRRLRLGRIPSVVLAVLVALGIIVAIGTAIGSQVTALSQDLPQYEATIEQKIAVLRDNTVNKLNRAIANVSHQFASRTANTRETAPPNLSPREAERTSPGQSQQPVPVVVTQPAPSALAIAQKVLSPLLHPLATVGIILVVSIFALLQREDLRDRAIRLFGSSDLQRTTVAMNDAGRRLSRYFLTQLGLNTAFGIIVAIGLWLIGVPHPLLWGILGLLLRFIPVRWRSPRNSRPCACGSIALAAPTGHPSSARNTAGTPFRQKGQNHRRSALLEAGRKTRVPVNAASPPSSPSDPPADRSPAPSPFR